MYSDDDIINEIQRVHSEHGNVSRSLFDRCADMNSGTVVNRFGSWNGGLDKAGIETVPPGGHIDNGITGSEYYNELLNRISCVACDEGCRACLQFHHVKEKKAAVSTLVSAGARTSSQRVYEEVEKTIPLCANCHAKHHSNDSEFSADDYWPFNWPHPSEI